MGFSVRVLVARVVDHGSPTFRVAAATFWLFISPGGQRTSCSDVAQWHWKRKQGLLRNSFQLSSLDYSIAGIWGNKISPRCFHSLRIVHLLTAKFSFWYQSLCSTATKFLTAVHFTQISPRSFSTLLSVQQNEARTWICYYWITIFYKV